MIVKDTLKSLQVYKHFISGFVTHFNFKNKFKVYTAFNFDSLFRLHFKLLMYFRMGKVCKIFCP